MCMLTYFSSYSNKNILVVAQDQDEQWSDENDRYRLRLRGMHAIPAENFMQKRKKKMTKKVQMW